MSNLNLVDEMAKGCLYRGGKAEDAFWQGYWQAAIVLPGLIVVGYGIELLLKWLF